MTRVRLEILLTGLTFIMLVALSTTASSAKSGDYWVFVSAYLLIGLFAIFNRYWIAAAAAFAVVAVRAMVALKISGLPFEIASSTFAALFFLLVQDGVNKCRAKE